MTASSTPKTFGLAPIMVLVAATALAQSGGTSPGDATVGIGGSTGPTFPNGAPTQIASPVAPPATAAPATIIATQPSVELLDPGAVPARPASPR